MSAYAHQMEREISFLSQSTPSARTSELGSHYEPGFTISSFTATVLIGALVVAGVSLAALLTALTIMLQSCRSKSAGIIDLSESKSVKDNTNMCKMLVLHAELNGLSADHIPLKCKEDATRYITSGQYTRDLEFAISLVVGYFSSLKPDDDGLDIILMDADDHFPLVHLNSTVIQSGFIVEADIARHILMLGLYEKLRGNGWEIVLVSRKPVEERNATMDYLVSSGYADWLLLIMRESDEVEMDSSAYMSRQRAKLQEEGKRIVGIVSTKMDALSGTFSGKQMFKLPTNVYYHWMYM